MTFACLSQATATSKRVFHQTQNTFNRIQNTFITDEIHDTGLLLADSGGTPTLQLHDSNESIASDGSKVIITSGGTAFSLPTSDGSNGQAVVTNGSGVLSFADAGASVAFNAFEYTATQGQTSFSGNDDNSNSLSYTAGVNSVQVYLNGVSETSSNLTSGGTFTTTALMQSSANMSVGGGPTGTDGRIDQFRI